MTCTDCEHARPTEIPYIGQLTYCWHPEMLSQPLATRRLAPCIPNPAACPVRQAIRAKMEEPDYAPA
jgi:hypothetical protein